MAATQVFKKMEGGGGNMTTGLLPFMYCVCMYMSNEMKWESKLKKNNCSKFPVILEVPSYIYTVHTYIRKTRKNDNFYSTQR